ncbi:hypothetical protein L7F22_003867 [Adiantum nelumboides]|nr:hypothetical protein [Adiantum nelumboides]
MAFPNFFGKQYESASNFLDDLEMAFLVSGRDEEEVKLRAFPLVLKDSAKNWFQNLEPGRKTNWETLKETFLSKYGGLDNPEHLWHRISSLHQATSRTYLTYESQFLRLWAEWEASLAEGERAPNFLKKEKFLARLFPDLQEKVKGKFPETFEEALQIAHVKDRKLEYQAHTSRVEHPQGPTMADERLPPAPTTTPEDPHLELLQRVTNQLDNLSINMVQGVHQQQPQPNNERMPNGPRRQPQRRDYFCYNCGEEGHGMYFCPHPRNVNAQAGRGRQQVTPPRARPPPQIQPQILQNPQMVAQPEVLQRSVAPQPVAEIPPLPNNNVKQIATAADIAQVFVKEIVKLHGIPARIISDRDAKFTSKFWQAMFQSLGTQSNLSTAYHPETDGQMEQVNHVIEDMLRAYCNQQPKKWIKFLHLVEFAYKILHIIGVSACHLLKPCTIRNV